MSDTRVDDKYKVIGETNEHWVLQVNVFINNSVYYYFMMVPKKSNIVQILLGFRKNGIKDYADFPALDNKAIVVPVLSDAMSNYMSSQQTDGYTVGIKYFYKILSDSVITLRKLQKGTISNILVNNDGNYSDFINSFIDYSKISVNGISCEKTTSDLLKKEEILTNVSNEVKTGDVPVAYPNPSEEFFQEQETKGMTKKLTKKSEPGFVSYVLLGVVIAVASLLFLYMLL